MREGKEAVAFVRERYEDALAEVDKLVKERQCWQEAWDEERQCAEADKAALLASIEVSAALYPPSRIPGCWTISPIGLII